MLCLPKDEKRAKRSPNLPWKVTMKRFAALVSALMIVGIVAVLVWSGRPSDSGAPSLLQSPNLAPRPLDPVAQSDFLKLVCGQASGPAGGYAHQCQSLPGYPSADYGGAGLGLGITLQSVAYGHFTSATANEAYVTYAGNFEPHANNYGGGILFTKKTGGWTLKAWYPGGQASHCVLLTPTGRARFVCLNSWEGQGEADSNLTVTTLPPPLGNHPTLISASDLRDTLNPNANCQTLQPGQAILLSIDSLSPAPDGAKAEISFVSAATAQTKCASSSLASAPLTHATLTLHWQNDHIHITPLMDFAAKP